MVCLRQQVLRILLVKDTSLPLPNPVLNKICSHARRQDPIKVFSGSLGLGFPTCKTETVVLIFQGAEKITINVLRLWYISDVHLRDDTLIY